MGKFDPVYEEIRIEKVDREIWALTIRPSFGGALTWVQTNGAHTISCTLESTLLEDAEPFEALSYCWDSDKNMKRISLNERSFLLREILWLALKHLQQKKVPRRIWVDAVCINQDSYEERNAQVSIMKNIYSAVTMVVVWIGAEVKHVKTVFEYCNILCPSDSNGPLESDKPQILQSAPKLSQNGRKSAAGYHLGLSNASYLEDIYSLEWFGRIWIGR